MQQSLSERKVIIVTGASSGIGMEGASQLIQAGHIVYCAARRTEDMAELVAAGGHPVIMDVTNGDSIKAAVDQVIAERGRIDVLWNNAGFSVAGAVEDVSTHDAQRQFDVNVFGVANVTKAVLPQMRSQGSGTVINTSSVGGKISTPLNAWYHASKFALEGWSDCLRLELAPFGINVVVLEPGGIKTAFGKTMYEPLRVRAKGGAYEAFTNRIADAYEANYSPSNRKLSHPSVVGKIVVEILKSKTPATRYAMGYGAKPALWMRKFLSDRLFDRMIMGQY